MRADLDAFAHGVRDKDIDDETVAMFKQRPNLVLDPEPAGPRREGGSELAARRACRPRSSTSSRRQTSTGRRRSAFYGIQARNLAKMNAAGVRITMGTDGNRPWGPHEEMEDMVLAGMTPAQVIVAATRNGAEFLRSPTRARWRPARAPTSSCSTPIRSTTSPTRGKISSVVLRGAAVDRSKPVQ